MEDRLETTMVLPLPGTTPIAWIIESGNLPSGLTLAPNGTISGNPNSANTYNFTVKATNTGGSDTKALTIVIGSSGGGTSGAVTINEAALDEPRYYGQVQFNNGNATVNYDSPTFHAGMLGGD